MLASLSCALLTFALAPQSQADAPQGMTVVIVDVGQGDGAVVRAPDGTVHVFDAGPSGQGTLSMLPTIASLAPTGYGYTVLSHYHSDHLGGLDEVLNALPFQTALDRGFGSTPSTSAYNNYASAASGVRQSVSLGTTYQLGGGATMTCICVGGAIMGGGFVDPNLSSQEENSRSVVMRLDYGDFSMWIGGDLTGGGNGTTDVEGPASAACGDIDVYKLNHHGSNTSSTQTLLDNLDPELAVVSCGDGNPYGHPTPTVTNRINKATAMRTLLSTTEGSNNTIGFGVTGNIRIDTDGYRYRATAENGDFLDFYCDEVAPANHAVGDVLVSEVLPNPSVVADTNGEYVELVNVGGRPLALKGLSLGDNGGTVTIASNLMLVPGRPIVFQRDGAPSRNGGQPMGITLPFSSLQWGNSSDAVVVSQGATTLDFLSYSGSFPDGSGVAAERSDLLAPHQSGSTWNYDPAPNPFGDGDRGSPGERNPLDATDHPVQVGVTTRPGAVTLHAVALDDPFQISVLGISNGTIPGFFFGGALIPLNFDQLFSDSLGAPGVLALMPHGGYRSLDIPVPDPNPLAGLTFYTSHIVLDFGSGLVEASPAESFQLQ